MMMRKKLGFMNGILWGKAVRRWKLAMILCIMAIGILHLTVERLFIIMMTIEQW